VVVRPGDQAAAVLAAFIDPQQGSARAGEAPAGQHTEGARRTRAAHPAAIAGLVRRRLRRRVDMEVDDLAHAVDLRRPGHTRSTEVPANVAGFRREA
jgi:hypothetical protein